MGCQSLMKTRGMESLKWTEAVKLQLLVVLLIELTAIVSAMSIGDNTVGFAQQKQQQQGYGFHRMPYKSPYQMKKQQLQAQQQQRRMKQTGNEIIPAVGTNAISDEPTCDELRAMWRYYKRQSRAELTNEIPQFGKNPFFEMLPAPRNPMLASFGIGSKPRMKNPLRPQNPLYGRVVQKPSKPRERGRSRNPKPFEVVRELMRNPSGNGMPTNVNVHTAAEAIANRENTQGRVHPADVTEVVTTPGPAIAIVHFSPSRRPPKQSSFQTLRNMIASERQRERETSMGSSSGSPNMGYGKVILSPPTGQDGRRINKPPERMTPFEKIRFGHADDILDEGIRPNLNVMKRRTLPMSVLKTQWKQQQQQNKYQALHKRRFLTNPFPFLIPSSGSSDGSGGSRGGGEGDQTNTYTSSKYFEKRTEENNKDKSTIAITNDKKQLDSLFENDNVPSPLEQDNPIPVFANNDINNNINNGDFKDPVDELSSYSSRSTSSALSKYPTNPLLTVEIPTCAEVEHEPCNQTLDCACIGFALYRCYLNQCQILPLAFSVQEEPITTDDADTSSSDTQPDIWHSEPLPPEKLGIWQEPVVVVNVDDTSSPRLISIRERRDAENKDKSNDIASKTSGKPVVLQQQIGFNSA